jgi:hypothetical protein
MRCPKGGDVRSFLTTLRFKHQELAATGVILTDWDYQQTVLQGIPDELARFVSSLLSAHRIANPSSSTSLGVNTLISHICEEADRIKNCCARPANGKKDSQPDEALAVTNGNGGKKKRRKGKCRNCDKPGHWE